MTNQDHDQNQDTPPVGATPNAAEPTYEEITEEPMLRLFRHQHLRDDLKAVVRPFAELARHIAALPRNPERTAALRKLREAKDCACTALLWDAT